MGKPRTRLSTVAAESLETGLNPICQPRSVPRGILEHEHPDRPGLAVAHRGERERSGCRSLLAERLDDVAELGERANTEERKSDVKARRRATPDELLLPPLDELGDHVVRHLEREKEPGPLIPLDGSSCAHGRLCRLCETAIG